jgi:hypothetical protein
MSANSVQDVSTAFNKGLIQQALRAELSHYLGYLVWESKPES